MTEAINVPGVEGIPAASNGIKVSASASLVYCSGQIAATGHGAEHKLVEGTIAEKLEFIFDNLEKVLKAGGSSLNQLVKVNIYITDFGFFGELNEYYIKRVPSPKPPRTCVQVAALPFGAEIEIEAIGWTEQK